ncbi:TetR/AcrR family transcriptional regulator [Streptomyces sp. NPDC127068]|uniref:TetR/AcrR family transcriptional regulator n=1 Tax=Streptomyces sp. NPDC127068 TaxID=3347127 RepID=UPI00364FCB42
MADGITNGPQARRPGGRNARVRERILGATAELVARDGVAGFRYDEVAELAGVHRTSVYRNWPDREELVAEALIQYAEGLATIADTGDLRHDLVDYLVAIAGGLATPFGRALELALQPTHENPAVRETVAKILEQRGAATRTRLDLATRRGELPPVDSVFLGELLSGPVHLVVNRGLRPFTRADAERIVDVILAGVRAAPPAPTPPA